MKRIENLSIAVVGCGSFSNFVHGPAHQKLAFLHPWVKLAACCDKELPRAQGYAKKFGFQRAYNDVETMLKAEEPDAVFLVVPPPLTAPVASVILKQNRPLFLEKPPGITPQELAELVALANRAGVPTQVGFNRRYMPLGQLGRKILTEKFPSIFQVDYQLIRVDRNETDFSTTAIHAIDHALFLAGSPCRKASLTYQKVAPTEPGAVNIALQAECESGSTIRINIQPMGGLVSETATIHGCGQTLILDLLGSAETKNRGQLFYYEGNCLVQQCVDTSVEYIDHNGIFNEVVAFYHAVRQGSAASPALRECAQQVALMSAIRERLSSVRFSDMETLPASAFSQITAANDVEGWGKSTDIGKNPWALA